MLITDCHDNRAHLQLHHPPSPPSSQTPGFPLRLSTTRESPNHHRGFPSNNSSSLVRLRRRRCPRCPSVRPTKDEGGRSAGVTTAPPRPPTPRPRNGGKISGRWLPWTAAHLETAGSSSNRRPTTNQMTIRAACGSVFVE